MNGILAKVYKEGQAAGYSNELGRSFQPGKNGLSAAQIKEAVFELGKIGGKSLGEDHRHGVIAFTSPELTKDEAADLYRFKIPTSFYPVSNQGILTEEGLVKLVKFMSKSNDTDVNNNLATGLAGLIGTELNIHGNDEYTYSNVPFFIKSPVEDTIKVLNNSSAKEAMQEFTFFDLKTFLEASEETRDQMNAEAIDLMNEDGYSTIGDTLGAIFYHHLKSGNLDQAQAAKAIINLQKVVRQYSAQADTLLHGDEF